MIPAFNARLGLLLVTIPALFLLIFFVAPNALLLTASAFKSDSQVLTHELTTENYAFIFGKPLYLRATGPCMCHGFLRQGYDPEDISHVVRKLFDGRLRYHDGMATLAPGIEVHRVGGHTDGQQVVRVMTWRGWMVLASDAVHFRENFIEDRPFPGIYHVGAALDGFQTLRRLVDDLASVIPGHDPAIIRDFPPANDAAAGIAVRLD